ncbi:MAG: hypothetical protein R3B91_03005 [Planctomycetaceae bacterium]
MTQAWRLQQNSSWLRTTAMLMAAALFLCGLAAFFVTLIQPFEAPRLILLTCDGDPATAGASPFQQLATSHHRGLSFNEVTTPPGPDWLQAIENLGDDILSRDVVIVSLRGNWVDTPEGALSYDNRQAPGAAPKLLLLDDILEQLNDLPATTVVLCLDDADPDLDQFSERLQEAQSKADANRVVIVTSHRLGEESFPLPMRRCTAFGHVISRALCSVADRNHDSVISMQEFLTTIERDVQGWAAELTGGRESQTPLVIAPSGLSSEATVCQVLKIGATSAVKTGGTAKNTDDGASSDRTAGVELSRVTTTWDLATELTDRALAGDVPLVVCRGMHRDLVELERRWRFGESTPALRDAYDAMQATLESLSKDHGAPANSSLWASLLADLLEPVSGGKSVDAASSSPADRGANTQDSPSAQPTVRSLPVWTGSSRMRSRDSSRMDDLRQLQEMISSEKSRDAIVNWLEQESSDSQSRTAQLARKLSDLPNIPDDLWTDVLLARVMLELNTQDKTASSWCYDEWTHAEQAALRSERLLLDQVEHDWIERAQQSNAATMASLMRGHEVDALHRSASKLCRNLLLILPDLLETDRRLQFWENDPAEVGDVLNGVLQSVAELRRTLWEDSLPDTGHVAGLVRAIEADRRRLAEPVHQLTTRATMPSLTSPPASDLLRALRSELLTTQERASLLAVWQELGNDLPVNAPHPTSAGRVIVHGLSAGLKRNFQRREFYNHLFKPITNDDQAREQPSDDADLLDSLLAYQQAETAWCHQRPGEIRHQLEQSLSMPIDAGTLARAQVLWDACDGLTDEAQLPPQWPQLSERIEQCRTTQHLDWQIQRVNLARNDASDWEADCYDERESDLRASRPIFRAWPPPEYDSSTLLGGPLTAMLSNKGPVELRFVVHNMSNRDQDYVLTMQYPVDEYLIESQVDRAVLPADAPPWPYGSTGTQTGLPLSVKGLASRDVTLRVQPRSVDARPATLLIRLRGEQSTVRATCELNPPRKIPIELILEDEFGPVIEDDRGFTVEPFPNRVGTLHWLLQNNSETVQHVRFSVHVLDAVPPELPREVIPTASLTDFLGTLSRETHSIELPVIELRPHGPPQPVVFPKEDDTKAPLAMMGGLVVVLSDESTGLTTLRQVRMRPQRPLRFAVPQIDYEQTTGRISLRIDARDIERLPREGIPVSAALANDSDRPLPARTIGTLSRQSPRAILTLLAEPEQDHRVHVHVAGWPRAFIFDIIDGTPTPLREPQLRITSPEANRVYQTINVVPVSVQLDSAPVGLVSTGDSWFEVGVDADHDRRLTGEAAVRIEQDRHVTVAWLGANPNGTTQFQVGVQDFDLLLPTSGLHNQRAGLLGRIVREGHPDLWSEAVPIVFDTSGPKLADLELLPGPVVTIGESIVVTARADDQGLSGVSDVQLALDPTREGVFGPSIKPISSTPLEDGTWRAEMPTKSLEQGQHLLLVRGVDQAGNAEDPHPLWLEAITPEEAARRQSARTTSFSGQLFYGTEPASGFKVELIANEAESSAPEKPITPEKSVQSKKSFNATSGKDGRFVIQSVTGGVYSLHISGVLRGEKIERDRTVTIDVNNPPAALAERLDRPLKTASAEMP